MPDATNAGLEIAAGNRGSERILQMIKVKGPQSSSLIAAELGVTGEAVRQQLVKLAEDGLIVATKVRNGVGRPLQLWRLTETGDARFPDRHSLVTLQLIDEIRSLFDESTLLRIIDSRSAKVALAYADELADSPTLKERVAKLAMIRAREGYMAEWREEPDGSFMLIENHCPICAAAKSCQGFCKAERDTFQEVLGGSNIAVTRVQHILSGARLCAYKIHQIQPGKGNTAKATKDRPATSGPGKRTTATQRER
jgi:predicted ArsR family transcriptional regulator